MADKKMRLTESELKQVVEASVRQILLREGFGDWASDKFDNIFRGYKVREGKPQNVFDVVKSNGWTYNEENPFDVQTKTIKVQKATGAFGGHYGLTINELIDDINIFLNGKGKASLKGKTKPYEYEIFVNAPINIIQGNSMNESIYGNDGFESTSTMDVNRQPQRSFKDEIDMVHDLWWMINDKGEHDEDGYHCYLSDGIMFNNVELEVIHTSSGPNYPMIVFGTNKKGYYFDKLPYEVQQQIVNDIEAYEPEEYEEEYDDNDEF